MNNAIWFLLTLYLMVNSIITGYILDDEADVHNWLRFSLWLLFMCAFLLPYHLLLRVFRSPITNVWHFLEENIQIGFWLTYHSKMWYEMPVELLDRIEYAILNKRNTATLDDRIYRLVGKIILKRNNRL